ncbi:hypothetical protein [Fodinicola feengrottensis]|uniref:Flagellar protein FlgN n=1 Tax=Fodinicola feengrottensis TaxID=435914 RepID=A0ABP4U5D3_9ACTN|nr:hypothetical protein [Fodinicola feengrottensis]
MDVEFDIDSLQDFRKALETRLSQAQTILSAVRKIPPSGPPVGNMADGEVYTSAVRTRNNAYVERLTRLHESIKVAIAGTDQIIHNYSTVEALNHANAQDVAGRIAPVGATLAQPGEVV